jgi:hypothetical protein
MGRETYCKLQVVVPTEEIKVEQNTCPTHLPGNFCDVVKTRLLGIGKPSFVLLAMYKSVREKSWVH